MTVGWNETVGAIPPIRPKPPMPAINWRHPLALGLVFAQDYNFALSLGGGGHFDLVGQSPGAFTGGPGQSMGPFGQQFTFGNGTADVYTTPSAANSQTKQTVEFLAKPNVNDFGCFIDKGTNLFFNVGWVTGDLYLDMQFSTTNGEWKTVTGGTALPFDQFCHVIVSWDGSSLSNTPIMQINGVLQSPTNSSVPVGTRTDDNQLFVGNYPGLDADMVPDISYARMWNRILTAQERLTLFTNPWCLYTKPPARTNSSLPAQIYSVSITEAGSGADTVSDVATLPSAISESGTAADTVSNIATHPATISESGTAADTISNGSTYPAALVEAGTAADTVSDVATLPSVITETGTAADTVSSVATHPATVSESGSAADTVSDVAVLPSTITETGTAADTVSNIGTFPRALAEAGTAADTVGGVSIIPVAVVESGTAADTIGSAAVIPVAISEQANAQDHEDSSKPSDTSLVETMVATDSYSATVIAGATLADTLSAADTIGATLVIPATLAEAMSAADVIQAQHALSALLVEIADAEDTTNSILNASLSIVETANAADTLDSSRGVLVPSKCDSLKGPFIVRSLSGPADCGDCG